RAGEEHVVEDLQTLDVDLELLDRLLERLVGRQGRKLLVFFHGPLKYIDRTASIQCEGMEGVGWGWKPRPGGDSLTPPDGYAPIRTRGTDMAASDLLRSLPSVDEVLRRPEVTRLAAEAAPSLLA